MSIKTVTLTQDIRVCDVCGAEGDPTIRRRIAECIECGGDVCDDCSVRVVETGMSGTAAFCRSHIPPESRLKSPTKHTKQAQLNNNPT